MAQYKHKNQHDVLKWALYYELTMKNVGKINMFTACICKSYLLCNHFRLLIFVSFTTCNISTPTRKCMAPGARSYHFSWSRCQNMYDLQAKTMYWVMLRSQVLKSPHKNIKSTTFHFHTCYDAPLMTFQKFTYTLKFGGLEYPTADQILPLFQPFIMRFKYWSSMDVWQCWGIVISDTITTLLTLGV